MRAYFKTLTQRHAPHVRALVLWCFGDRTLWEHQLAHKFGKGCAQADLHLYTYIDPHIWLMKRMVCDQGLVLTLTHI